MIRFPPEKDKGSILHEDGGEDCHNVHVQVHVHIVGAGGLSTPPAPLVPHEVSIKDGDLLWWRVVDGWPLLLSIGGTEHKGELKQRPRPDG